jgi:hypothetical protein
MTQDEVIEMARQAGFITDGHWAYEFTTFAKLVEDAAFKRCTWVGLTDEEIDDIYWQHQNQLKHQVSIWPYERALEAKLKEKNNG